MNRKCAQVNAGLHLADVTVTILRNGRHIHASADRP